jgi:hypothetical protein
VVLKLPVDYQGAKKLTAAILPEVARAEAMRPDCRRIFRDIILPAREAMQDALEHVEGGLNRLEGEWRGESGC